MGTIQPKRIDISRPPNINSVLQIASDLPKKSVEIADGIPIKKINKVDVQTALFLLQLSLSIKEDTGTSIKETEEVIAAIKAKPKKTDMPKHWERPNTLKSGGNSNEQLRTLEKQEENCLAEFRKVYKYAAEYFDII